MTSALGSHVNNSPAKVEKWGIILHILSRYLSIFVGPQVATDENIPSFICLRTVTCLSKFNLCPYKYVRIRISIHFATLLASKDREEKLKYARDRQNEERHRKIEELRAQAEAAQRYREQKEEERRRRIEEIRTRDTEKRHQVEERKKAIFEAEKERREYILKKNQVRALSLRFQ